MKFTIDAAVLNKVLRRLHRLCSPRSSLPVLKCVLIEADAKTVRMTASNLEIYLRREIQECQVARPGSLAIDANALAGMISKLPMGMVEFESEDGLDLTVRCGKIKFALHGLPGSEYPALPAGVLDPASDTIQEDPKILREAIESVVFATSRDAESAVSCVQMRQDVLGGLTLAATDGYRLAWWGPLGSQGWEALIPAAAAQELIKILPEGGDQIRFMRAQNWLSTEIGPWTFLARLHEGAFPNWATIVPKQFQVEVDLKLPALVSLVDRAAITASERDGHGIDVTLAPDHLEVESKTAELGSFHEEIPATVTGLTSDLKLRISARFLQEGLRVMDGDAVKLQLNGAVQAVNLSGEDAMQHQILMPIRG